MSDWDYKNKPLCYGYRHNDDENIKIELEVAIEDPELPYSDVHISIFHDDVNDECVNTWVYLPLEEIEKLHTVLGNILEHASE